MDLGGSAGDETGDEGSGMGSTIGGGETFLGSEAVYSVQNSSGEDTGGLTYQGEHKGDDTVDDRTVDSDLTYKTDNTKNSYDSDDLESMNHGESSEAKSNPENDIGQMSGVAALALDFSNINANSHQKAPPAIKPQTETPAKLETGESERSGDVAAAPLG